MQNSLMESITHLQCRFIKFSKTKRAKAIVALVLVTAVGICGWIYWPQNIDDQYVIQDADGTVFQDKEVTVSINGKLSRRPFHPGHRYFTGIVKVFGPVAKCEF